MEFPRCGAMTEKGDLALYQAQVQTNVAFTAFMTAVVVFFAGLLITRFESYELSIKVPIAFLIVSIFGFLYSTVVFANASGEISEGNTSKFKKHMLLGDILSEYLGIYLLVVSVPLVINVVTQDVFLRAITVVSALSGLAIYQFSHFSVIEKHLESKYHVFSLAMILFGLLLYASQLYAFHFALLAVLFLAFVLSLSFITAKRNGLW